MEEDEIRVEDTVLEPPWRFRGRDLSRVLALSDGVFAFAMTLLVLGLAIPASTQGSALGAYLTSSAFVGTLFVYVLTFFVIFLWWQGHHLIFGYIRKYDRALLRINAIFLIFVAILPFATQALNASGNAPGGEVFFALTQVGAGGSLLWLWTYASGKAGLVHRGLPRSWMEYMRLQRTLPPVVFAASIPLAFLNAQAAEFFWVALFLAPLLARRRAPPEP